MTYNISLLKRSRTFLALSVLFSAWMIVSSLPSVFADEPQLFASLDKPTAEIDEEIHLNVKITGVQGSIQAPVLPPLEGFEVFYSGRGSRFSFINGRSESLTEFNYVLIPRMPGRFVIDPIEVRLNGKIYRTSQLELFIAEVNQSLPSPPKTVSPMSRTPLSQGPGSQGLAPLPAQGAPRPQAVPQTAFSDEEMDKNIFLRVVPSRVSVYTNEQMILSYSIFTRYDTRYEGFEEEPSTSGFWIEEFPLDYKNLGRDTELIGGRKYVRADIKKLALFPTAPGSYTIQPGRIKTSVQIQERTSTMFDQIFNDSFFSGSGLFTRRKVKYLTGAPIQVVVKPLPEADKPKSFKGAVGDFRMSTVLDKRVVNQNEAITLKIKIEGEGNIETLSLPELPNLAGTKIYESDTYSEFYRHEQVIAGSKTFEVIFIPGETGELVIPGIEFGFFNPRSERYITLVSDSYKIQVNPSKAAPAVLPEGLSETVTSVSKKQIQRESEDIYYIKEEIKEEPWITSPHVLFGLATFDGLLTLALIGIGIHRQRLLYLEQNVSLKRNLSAKRAGRRGLKRLEHLSKVPDRDTERVRLFFDEGAKVLNQYLSGKLNLSAHGMTRNVVERELISRSVNPEIVKIVHHCFDLCDQARFGQMSLGAATRKELIESIAAIINVMERM